MKLAVITPPQGLKTLTTHSLGYHMVLGQYAMRQATYRGFYAVLHRIGHHILVDNGTAEKDVPPFRELVSMAEEMGYDEIILPDRRRDGRGTIDAIRECAAWQVVPKYKRAVCPQGETHEEWFECLKTMEALFQFNTICVAKNVTYTPGGRPELLRRMVEAKLTDRYHIHMLGCVNSRPIAEALECLSAFPGIRGIDTAAPIAYAQCGKELVDNQSHCSLSWEAEVPWVLACHNTMKLETALYAAKVSWRGLR